MFNLFHFVHYVGADCAAHWRCLHFSPLLTSALLTSSLLTSPPFATLHAFLCFHFPMHNGHFETLSFYGFHNFFSCVVTLLGAILFAFSPLPLSLCVCLLQRHQNKRKTRRQNENETEIQRVHTHTQAGRAYSHTHAHTHRQQVSARPSKKQQLQHTMQRHTLSPALPLPACSPARSLSPPHSHSASTAAFSSLTDETRSTKAATPGSARQRRSSDTATQRQQQQQPRRCSCVLVSFDSKQAFYSFYSLSSCSCACFAFAFCFSF